ncbi:hypothetical protein SAMN02745202_02103 [Segatella oulorum]|uniref:Uncharacterized protein n=1 Tax=Segatella oulorum TaxID=28136 RepID=A0A1T4R634_9BACT|nr:hypothetical protein SAMN02745202_02103 [Segatella oulorum]
MILNNAITAYQDTGTMLNNTIAAYQDTGMMLNNTVAAYSATVFCIPRCANPYKRLPSFGKTMVGENVLASSISISA